MVVESTHYTFKLSLSRDDLEVLHRKLQDNLFLLTCVSQSI